MQRREGSLGLLWPMPRSEIPESFSVAFQEFEHQSAFQGGQVFLVGTGGFVGYGHGKPAFVYHGQHIGFVVFSLVGHANMGEQLRSVGRLQRFGQYYPFIFSYGARYGTIRPIVPIALISALSRQGYFPKSAPCILKKTTNG